MKNILLTTIAAVLVVGCGEAKQAVPAPETKPEPATAKAPDISIHKAARDGKLEAVKQRLAIGTDVNAKDDHEWTPLHSAAFNGHKEIVKLLIAKGAEVNAKAGNGMTPLRYVAQEGHKEIAELLISEGADVNAKGDDGITPLHRAVGHKEVAELLIAKGAEVNAKAGSQGKTPLDLAKRLGQSETIDLLRKHGGKYGTFIGAAEGGDIDTVKMFLDAGTDVNAKDEYGNTPLDMADDKETADLLRKHGGKTGEELKAEGK
jgi:ankyrin repeat protein